MEVPPLDMLGWKLTQSTWWKCRRWLGICCSSGSPGRSLSLQSGRQCRQGPSRTPTRSAWTPWGTWPRCQKIWGCMWRALSDVSIVNQNHPEMSSTYWIFFFNSLAKHRVELLRDVILFVFDLWLAQLDDNVRIGLPIDVGRMKVGRLRQSETEQS